MDGSRIDIIKFNKDYFICSESKGFKVYNDFGAYLQRVFGNRVSFLVRLEPTDKTILRCEYQVEGDKVVLILTSEDSQDKVTICFNFLNTFNPPRVFYLEPCQK